MIEFEQAIQLIIQNTPLKKTEQVGIEQSLDCFLAQDVLANTDLPRFTSSAADGYAVKVNDVKNANKKYPVSLPLRGEIKAGDFVNVSHKQGETYRILTGAPIPKNVDAVVMKEFTEQIGEDILFKTSAEIGQNIRYQGEEFKKGSIILPHTTLINPAVVGALASLGIRMIKVYKRPKVALLVTGNELVPLGKKLKHGQIYDSNYHTLSSALRQMDIQAINLGIAKDDKVSLSRKIKSGIAKADVLIVSGGISVGEYDYVQEIFEKFSVKKIFWRVAIKPGKPTYFGVKGRKLVFGLPGNPVASSVTFHQFVKPTLIKMMGGRDDKQPLLTANINSELKKKSRRLEFVRGVLKYSDTGDLHVTPIAERGSHMLGSFAKANCLIHFPKDEEILLKGSYVTITPINWSLL